MNGKFTKKNEKDLQRITAWLAGKPFSENSRDKNPQVPTYNYLDLFDQYVPSDITNKGSYYTPPETADELLTRFLTTVPLSIAIENVIEPCAGIGGLLFAIKGFEVNVYAYELDPFPCDILKKIWTTSPTSWKSFHAYQGNPIEGDMNRYVAAFDLMLLNAPYNVKWGLSDVHSEWGVTKSEHLFLELGSHLLAPGGVILTIGTYNYLDTIPKKAKPHFEQAFPERYELGSLGKPFKYASIEVFGFALVRGEDNTSELLTPGEGATIDIIESTPILDPPRTPESSVPEKSIQSNTPAHQNAVESVSVGQGESQLSLVDLVTSTPPKVAWERELRPDFIRRETHLDERLLVPPGQDFIDSIKRWGIRDKITLTIDAQDNLELRDGRRRLAAALALNLPFIPCICYELDSLSGSALTLDANIQRRPNPLAELEAIRQVFKEAEQRGIMVTESDIQTITGMPTSTIRKRLKLKALPDEILAGIANKQITMKLAEKVANDPPSMQQQIAKLLTTQGKVKAGDYETLRQAVQDTATEQIPWNEILSQENRKIYVVVDINGIPKFCTYNQTTVKENTPSGGEYLELEVMS